VRRLLLLPLLLAAAAGLGACNAAVSDRPLFSARDARGAPALKPGLWAMVEDEPCDLERVATDPWPACAKPVVITARTIAGPEKDKPPLPYVLAAGSPRILQLAMKDDDEPNETFWFYLALEPEPGTGPVTEATAWLVQCGPPPENQPTQLTEQPLPGMSIEDKTCYAAAAGAIRDAAGPSRAWGDSLRLVRIETGR
jgi:hypothetical protein